MKKKPDHQATILRYPVKLSLKDVEILYTLVLDTAQDKSRVTLDTDEYELKDINDYYKIDKDYVHELTISAPSVGIYIHIDYKGAYISRTGALPIIDAAYSKAIQIIKSRKRRIMSVLLKSYLLFIAYIPMWVLQILALCKT